ncbi:MAG: HEAT repeat domain-containing protein [Anaerolineae bacterium]|nr:HEAT repeat domain-containing protein [Anaerolineae bacterium]
MDNLVDKLCAAIAAGDEAEAEQLAQVIGKMGKRAGHALRDMLAAGERDHRWWAVRALAAAGSVPPLVAALEDPDADVRACAVVGLAELRPPEAVLPLTALLSDPSAYVARLAADALARFGRPAAAALIAALQDGDVAARAGAARALSSIQPPEAIPALCAALDDPSAIVTHYAQEALEQMGVGMVLFRPA